MRRRLFIVLVLVAMFIAGAFVYLAFFARNNDTGEPRTFLGLELPFGNPTTTLSTGDDPVVDEGITPSDDPLAPQNRQARPTLFKISNQPVAGFAIYTRPKDILSTIIQKIEIPDPSTGESTTEEIKRDVVKTVQTPRVRYVDSLLGNIYETEFLEQIEEKYIAKTGIVDIGQAFFGVGDALILRSYNMINARIETQRGRLTSSLGVIICPQDFSKRLTVGATGREVEELQSFLKTFLQSKLEPEPGVFDQTTQTLVQEFQKSLGMKADGVVGAKTNQELTTICVDQERQRRIAQVQSSDSLPYIFSKNISTENSLGVVTSPDMNRIFTLTRSRGTVSGVISDVNGANARQVYDLPFSDWIIEWPSAQYITLTTKASGYVPGYMYTIDTETGVLQKVFGNQLGLTTRMSPDGRRVLFARYNAANTIEFGVFDMSNQHLKTFSLKTLPEKCVWAKDSVHIYCGVPEFMPAQTLYPDEWYQYQISFDDALWHINVLTDQTELINTLNNFDTTTVDIIEPRLTPDEDFLLFKDNITHHLWGYDLAGSR